uniref:Putative zinc finger, CCCH-type n=1 Tax=Helianthus annuus TaxID=4232 RepID=A0A251TXC1_HELAN
MCKFGSNCKFNHPIRRKIQPIKETQKQKEENVERHAQTECKRPMLVSEYPERPSQPDCSYFMKTGDCKYRTSCKFNHPQSRTTTTLRVSSSHLTTLFLGIIFVY